MSEFPEADDAKENPERMESAGNGANKYTYFVATDIEKSEKKWIQLPNVTPDQIKKCRQIYRLFTGHLQSAVHGRVHFEWNEAVLLRAQISRIASAAIIAPNDFYVKSEEDAEDDDDENPSALEVNEEFQFLENSMSHQSWVHARPHLRLEGRCVKFVEPEVDDEAEEEEDAEKEEIEPTAEQLEEEIENLQSISADKCSEYSVEDGDEEDEQSNVWNSRQLNQNIGYQITILNNKLWMGAKTIYLNDSKTFMNIYVGDGIKYRSEYYTPEPPAMIQTQFNEWKDTKAEEDEEVNEDDDEDVIADDDKKKIEKQSIFEVQTEQMPPPEPEPLENEENENASGEDVEQEEDS